MSSTTMSSTTMTSGSKTRMMSWRTSSTPSSCSHWHSSFGQGLIIRSVFLIKCQYRGVLQLDSRPGLVRAYLHID
jgi:hypothetical protein